MSKPTRLEENEMSGPWEEPLNPNRTPLPSFLMPHSSGPDPQIRHELEALDRLEAARQIIEMMLAGHAGLDPDAIGHLGHMLTAAAQRLAYAENFVGDGRE